MTRTATRQSSGPLLWLFTALLGFGILFSPLLQPGSHVSAGRVRVVNSTPDARVRAVPATFTTAATATVNKHWRIYYKGSASKPYQLQIWHDGVVIKTTHAYTNRVEYVDNKSSGGTIVYATLMVNGEARAIVNGRCFLFRTLATQSATQTTMQC